MLNYGSSSTGLLYSTVKSWIQQYRPVFATVTRTGGAHALAICGYQSAYGYYYYTFMDCNIPPSTGNSTSCVTISVSSSSTNFTYVTSYGYTYTAWARSMY